MTLLRAYLVGSSDPFVLAKAYYDDMIEKDVTAVEAEIDDALGFKWHESIKWWKADLQELEKELSQVKKDIDTLKSVGQAQGPLITPQFGRGPKRGEFGNLPDEIRVIFSTVEELEQVMKELLSDIDEAHEVIDGMEEEKKEMTKEISGYSREEWTESMRFQLTELGLTFLKRRLKETEATAERLGVLKVPDDRVIEGINNRWKTKIEGLKLGEKFSETKMEYKRKWNEEIRSVLDIQSAKPMFRKDHYKKLIGALKTKVANSERKLETLLSASGKKETRAEAVAAAEKKGYKKTINWLRFREVDEKGNTKIHEYNPETKDFDLIPEEKKVSRFTPSEDAPEAEPITYTSGSFIQALTDTMHYPKGAAKTKSRKELGFALTPKKFKDALEEFFSETSATYFEHFKETPIPGDVVVRRGKHSKGDTRAGEQHGMGFLQISSAGTEKVKRVSSEVRLKNLKRLKQLFEDRPKSLDADRNALYIVKVLDREIDIENKQIEREALGAGEFTEKYGKKELKRLSSMLMKTKHGLKHYREGKYPQLFLLHVSELKAWRVKLVSLQRYSKGFIPGNEKKFINDEMPEFNSIQKILESKVGGEPLIYHLKKAWHLKEVTEEELSGDDIDKIQEAIDKLHGNLIERLDSPQWSKEPDINRIEKIIETIKESLEDLENQKNEEFTDDLTRKYTMELKNLGKEIQEVLLELPPGEDRKKVINTWKIFQDELSKRGIAFKMPGYGISEGEAEKRLTAQRAWFENQIGEFQQMAMYITPPTGVEIGDNPYPNWDETKLKTYMDAMIPDYKKSSLKKTKDRLIGKIINHIEPNFKKDIVPLLRGEKRVKRKRTGSAIPTAPTDEGISDEDDEQQRAVEGAMAGKELAEQRGETGEMKDMEELEEEEEESERQREAAQRGEDVE